MSTTVKHARNLTPGDTIQTRGTRQFVKITRVAIHAGRVAVTTDTFATFGYNELDLVTVKTTG